MNITAFKTWLSEHKITARKIRAIVIHHFGNPSAKHWRGEHTIQAVRDYHTKVNGWRDIGYHFILGPDGTVWEGRDMNLQGAHCDGNNGNVGTLGVVFAANFNLEQPEDCGYTEGLVAIAELCKKCGFDPNELERHVVFHRMWDQTECPGKLLSYNAFIRNLHHVMVGEKMLVIDGQIVKDATPAIYGNTLYVDPKALDLFYGSKVPCLKQIEPLLAASDKRSGRVALRPYLAAKGRTVSHYQAIEHEYIISTK